MTSNFISEAEFDNIRINNVTLSDIMNTEGDETQIRELIPATIIEKHINNGDRGPLNYSYTYDGFEITFTGNAGTPDHPGLAAFDITNSNWSITIQGKTVTIGSDIGILGNVVFNDTADGGKSIVYQYCDGCNNFIVVNFNQTTNKITEIGYIEIP